MPEFSKLLTSVELPEFETFCLPNDELNTGFWIQFMNVNVCLKVASDPLFEPQNH